MTRTGSIAPQSARHILVAGAAHIDRIGRLHHVACDGASVPGRFGETAGGTALNIASNLSTLGNPALPNMKVSLATITGRDPGGEKVRRSILDRGIISVMPQVGECQTASYTAVLQPNGDLLIAVADMEIYEQFDARILRPTIDGLGPDDWFVVDANLPASTINTLAKALAPKTAKLAVLTVSSAKAPRLRHLNTSIDLLCSNRREILSLAGMDINRPMSAAIDELKKMDISRAVVSDGINPVVVYENHNSKVINAPQSVSVADVTGAGDALAAGTLCRLVAGDSLVDAAKYGIAAARAVVRVEGPWRNDLPHAIDLATIPDMKQASL